MHGAGDYEIEVRTGDLDALADLTTIKETYDWLSFKHVTFYLDTGVTKWFLYQRKKAANETRVWTAPADLGEGDIYPPAPPQG